MFGRLLGWINERLDDWLGDMFDVDLGNLDDGPQAVAIDIWDVWLRRLIEDEA